MSKTINVNILSQKSIQNAIKEIRDYQNDFHRKLEVFVSRLADSGIEVAQNNVGGFGKYIVFSKEVDPAETGCTVIIHAKETGKIISSWLTKEGKKDAEVSPLLMAEFGSGFGAENPKNIPGVGQGTFPDQKHAKDPEGWYWKDLDGKLHHSKGIEAKMPMYKASLEIIEQCERIAKEVFSDGKGR